MSSEINKWFIHNDLYVKIPTSKNLKKIDTTIREALHNGELIEVRNMFAALDVNMLHDFTVAQLAASTKLYMERDEVRNECLRRAQAAIKRRYERAAKSFTRDCE